MALSDKHREEKETMPEEAFDIRELVAALNNDTGDAKPLTINDLPKEILVSTCIASANPTWVKHTFPRVCKEWDEIYWSKDASPLHETLEIDCGKEVYIALATGALEGWGRRRSPGPTAAGAAGQEAEKEAPLERVVDASRVISWAERRASSVRKLLCKKGAPGFIDDFGPKDLKRLFAAVASSLTELEISFNRNEGREKPFWDALRDSIAPTGRLRSLVVEGLECGTLESDLEPLGRLLAGSLEELVLSAAHPQTLNGPDFGLPSFPESLCALTELRRLVVGKHKQITALPAEISSLQKLKHLELRDRRLNSLPKELGELSGLTGLDLSGSEDLGRRYPADEAFLAELGKLKSLRHLDLSMCGLRTVPAFVGKLKSLRELDLAFCCLRAVPAFVGELKSLERLDLACNDNLQIDAPLD